MIFEVGITILKAPAKGSSEKMQNDPACCLSARSTPIFKIFLANLDTPIIMLNKINSISSTLSDVVQRIKKHLVVKVSEESFEEKDNTECVECREHMDIYYYNR
ncbi:hypothetical protein V1478_018885 [Vespula squamosa]|uniref:Uncharacterized protein n=1 Tax=Vespula squamosa TaxID=30214 RepID=A0ABD1ZU42_VESSQ